MENEITELSMAFGDRMNQMRNGQQGKDVISKEMRGHFESLKEWKAKKRTIFAARERIDGEINDLNRERDKLAKQCHPVYNTLDMLEKGIKSIEKIMTTNSLSNAQERQHI